MNKIINFHDVYDQEWFAKAIQILRKKYRLVAIKDIEEYYYEGKELKHTCHITIDDGDKSFYNVIYPVLTKYRIPATLFVSPQICSNNENFWFQEIRSFDENLLSEFISEYLSVPQTVLKSYPPKTILKICDIKTIQAIIEGFKEKHHITIEERFNMNVDELRQVDSDGLVKIGAHTQNHPILANEDDESCLTEVKDSIQELSLLLDHDIKYFAFPNGSEGLDFGQREYEFIRRNGIKLGFSTTHNNLSITDNRMAVPRFGLTYGNTFFINAKLMLGKYWDGLRKMKITHEDEYRIELKRILASMHQEGK